MRFALGIIGMGESMKQRVEFMIALRELNANSIPINILILIKGTSLKIKNLYLDEFLTVAIFRIYSLWQIYVLQEVVYLSRDTMER